VAVYNVDENLTPVLLFSIGLGTGLGLVTAGLDYNAARSRSYGNKCC